MTSSSIVRIGPNDDNLSAQLLGKAINSFFQQNNFVVGNDDTEYVNNDDNRKNDFRFTIRNKYFSAKIILKDIDNQHEGEESKTRIEDGIILVFDALQSNPDQRDDDRGSTMAELAGSEATFDSLQHTHQKSLSNFACGDLLRLCVGVSLAELSPLEIRGKDHEKEYARRVLWCLDNGYEYIEADLSKSGKQKGHDDRDKDGFARIVEAIEGTVWSSAAMSTSKSNKMKDSFADSKAKIQESRFNNSLDVVGINEKTIQNQYEPPDPLLLAPTDSQTRPTGQIQKDPPNSEFDKIVEDSNFKIDDSITTVFGFNDEKQGMDDEDPVADKLFVQMESVLQEASQIREASKNGILSDEERRERAGDAALALVNLMSQFGLDDNDDSSVDYGSDDSGIVDNMRDLK